MVGIRGEHSTLNWRHLTLFFVFLLMNWRATAHPMPNSSVLLNIHDNKITGEIQLPLGELQSAIGLGVNDNSKDLIRRLRPTLKNYLLLHIRPTSFDKKPWTVEIGEMKVLETSTTITGVYKELVVAFSITPPLNSDLRNFYFDYDAILHQVASHQILVNVKQDWQRGIVGEDSILHQIGVIALDIPSGKIPVFQVSLGQGSTWTGFKRMCQMGSHHISEGIDHLLFLLTLLLPAPLLVENKKWGKFGGWKYSLIRLLKIVSAFTLGHSLTLILAATQIVRLPTQPVEILIAISIFISAIHAYRPIFSGKEIWIAAGFGLIHGLAFAETLVNLDLGTKQLTLSVLGFNVGIELMQLVIVICIIPWLILLSKTPYYVFFRSIGSILVSLAAFGWIVERITNQPNIIVEWIARFS